MPTSQRGEVRRGNLVRLQQTFPQRRVAPRIVAAAFGKLRQRDAEFLREHADGVLKADLLVQLEKLEHVAADAAAETVEEPLLGVHVERRGLLVVERAVAFVRRARALQGYIFLHHRQDVGLHAQVVDELLREETH